MPLSEEKFIQMQLTMARIDSKLDDIGEIKRELSGARQQIAELDKRLSQSIDHVDQLEKDIEELENRNTWLTRTTVGAIITGVVGAILAFITG
ncbi:hemolysin family protein [Enterococcus phage Phi_Eg_SY1]|nr:hemolysin family protein [Enterococcus phage Phi_Eg_SY1]